MAFDTYPLFTVNLFKTSIKEWETCGQDLLDKIPFDDESLSDNGLSYTDYFNQGYEDKMSYRKEFMELIGPYLEEFNETSEYKFTKLAGCWCQRYEAHDYHQPHTHDSKGYSAVFYAKMSPEHKTTVFFAPFMNVFGVGESMSIQAKEGDLLIFPSNLWHMAPPHTTDTDRIVISFNLI